MNLAYISLGEKMYIKEKKTPTKNKAIYICPLLPKHLLSPVSHANNTYGERKRKKGQRTKRKRKEKKEQRMQWREHVSWSSAMTTTSDHWFIIYFSKIFIFYMKRVSDAFRGKKYLHG